MFRAPAAVAVAVGTAPFAVGALASPDADGPGLSLWPCPFQAMTGLPCPMCGATRSVIYFAHQDQRWLDYNPFWVLVLIAIALAGIVALGRQAAGRPPLPSPVARLGNQAPQLAVFGLLLVAGWAVALTHAAAITA